MPRQRLGQILLVRDLSVCACDGDATVKAESVINARTKCVISRRRHDFGSLSVGIFSVPSMNQFEQAVWLAPRHALVRWRENRLGRKAWPEHGSFCASVPTRRFPAMVEMIAIGVQPDNRHQRESDLSE